MKKTVLAIFLVLTFTIFVFGGRSEMEKIKAGERRILCEMNAELNDIQQNPQISNKLKDEALNMQIAVLELYCETDTCNNWIHAIWIQRKIGRETKRYRSFILEVNDYLITAPAVFRAKGADHRSFFYCFLKNNLKFFSCAFVQ